MALQLMQPREMAENPRDRLFRYSRPNPGLPAVAVICVGAALVILRWPSPRMPYCIAGALVLCLWLLRRFISARFRPSNWLVRQSGDGLFIQFRCYRNCLLPAEDPTVAFMPHLDIRSARLVRERTKTRDNDGSTSVATRRLIEFELAIDSAPLAAALAAECAKPGAWEKRWYGRSATLRSRLPWI
jgi:hypothetical protein